MNPDPTPNLIPYMLAISTHLCNINKTLKSILDWEQEKFDYRLGQDEAQEVSEDSDYEPEDENEYATGPEETV